MNEEDIKILEEFIKYFEAEAISRKYRRNISITVGEDDIESIENLISSYKKLNEKDKIIDLMINDLQEYVYNNQCKEEILEFYKNM